MKNFNVVFQNGHFWDASTRKRLIPKPGSKFALLSDDDSFQEHDPLNMPPAEIRSPESMKALVLSEPNLSRYSLLLEAGTLLSFRLGLGRRDMPEERMEYVFEVKLLEDLYIYDKSDWAKTTKPACFDCACVVQRESTGNLQFFEHVFGTSLNHLFENTSMLYYARKRSSSVNVFNEFKTRALRSEVRLGVLREKALFVKV